jgi:dUTPase
MRGIQFTHLNIGFASKLALFGFASICPQSGLSLHNPLSTLSLPVILYHGQIGFVLHNLASRRAGIHRRFLSLAAG